MSTESGQDIVIRPYRAADRDAVRGISVETAFLGLATKLGRNAASLLADFLTKYYTDYEPEACFVAADGGTVVGYLIGSLDSRHMRRVLSLRIVPGLCLKMLAGGALFDAFFRAFAGAVARAAVRGEFDDPDLTGRYPATLHINLTRQYRGRGIGRSLIEKYLALLRRRGVTGVHFGTLSARAKGFFVSCGFKVLYSGKRSYLRFLTASDTEYYILGGALASAGSGEGG